MSFEATNWVIGLKGLSPELRVVLLYLGNCHNPHYGGSFPSQGRLSAETEIPVSTLNRYLKELEARGFIAREQRVNPVTRKRESTRYHFPFEPDFDVWVKKPSPEMGDGEEPETDSQNETEPTPKNGENQLPDWESKQVIESVRESVTESPRAREADDESPKRLGERFKALEIGRHGNPWPDALKSSTGWGLKQFAALSPEERRLAEEWRDPYLAACPKVASGPRKGQPSAVPLGVYLRDRKFLDVAAIAPKAAKSARHGVSCEVRPFGPVWGAMRMLALLDGPDVIEISDDMRETVRVTFETRRRANEVAALAYLRRKGVSLGPDSTLVFPPGFEADERRRRQMDQGFPKVRDLDALKGGEADGRFATLSSLMEAVPVDGGVFADWREWHAARFFPFVPDPGGMRVVWFPKGGPAGIYVFESEARALLAKGDAHED